MTPADRPSPSAISLDRRHPVAKRVIASWRRLVGARSGDTGSEPTLIACSGGADSTALALALASTGARLTLVFVRHGARPSADVDLDRRIASALAGAIGAEFIELDQVAADGDSPSEATMRQNRYEALAAEARRRGIRFVATGHHADDQLETVLLGLLRGSGPRGLAGMSASRRVDDAEPPVALLRPMLDIDRTEIERLCRDFGVNPPGGDGLEWAEDRTNADTRFLRNRIRHEVVPLLEELQAGVASRVSRSAELLRQVAEVTRARVRVFDDHFGSDQGGASRSWPRAELRDLEPVEVGELLRWIVEARFDRQGLDRLDSASLMRIAAAIHDASTEPRRFELGAGLEVTILANDVAIARKSPA